jgi:hypothetical protein
MITLERIGGRVYLLGDTYPHRDAIKAAGGNWDSGRRAWWMGAAKLPAVQELVARLEATPAPPIVIGEGSRIVARARYKGRYYYVLWMGALADGAQKAHLTVLDGSIDFWADLGACEIMKRYPPREYRGRATYTTLGSIRRFIAQQSNRITRQGRCTECDHMGPAGRTCEECHEGTHV